jgi:coenzyme Q-binding protein COQ10
MPKARLLHRVPHRPADMLDLVTDIKRYPEFIKYVSAVRVLDHKVFSPSQESISADLGIQYKFLSEHFRSRVEIDKSQLTLTVSRGGTGGAVKALCNTWKFIELADGSTLIDFFIDVQLKAAPLEFIARQKFNKAADYIMHTFEARALAICQHVGGADYDWRQDDAAGTV